MIPEFLDAIKFLLDIKTFFDVDRRWPDGSDFAGERVWREGIRKRDILPLYLITWFFALIILALCISPFVGLAILLIK
jgi:hypothetical protein